MSELLTTARPYAKALFENAKNKNMIAVYLDMLKNLDAVSSEINVKNILQNDSYDSLYKANILSGILSNNVDENFLRFIKLLAENNRLNVISEILNLYDSYFQDEKNLKIAKINTAFELDEEQLKNIKQALEQRFKKEISLEQNVDPALLAGAVVKVDDLVIDGSLRERLRKLESQLI
jgi:F-type H+-transporting ATPase subunit delta